MIDGEYIECTDTSSRVASIGGHGLDICDEGQVTDTRGECITAHKFSPPKKEKDVEPREITSPKRKISLREYLQRLHSF